MVNSLLIDALGFVYAVESVPLVHLPFWNFATLMTANVPVLCLRRRYHASDLQVCAQLLISSVAVFPSSRCTQSCVISDGAFEHDLSLTSYPDFRTPLCSCTGLNPLTATVHTWLSSIMDMLSRVAVMA